jgi:O-antigen biosynthesis protein
MTSPSLSVVLVAWDSGESLGRAIEAIEASAREAGTGVELVVVDNASTDGAVEALALSSTEIVVRNPINVGYGVAAAQGASLASGSWVLFINPDVVVSRSFVQALVDAIGEAPANVATLVPDMRYASNPRLINCRGVTVDEIGIPAELDSGLESDQGVVPTEVFGGSTGCCLVRASALRSVGGFELCYFAYLEDVDLATRLQRAGFTARFVPAAIVYHEGSASLGEGSPLKTHLVARNRRLFFQLNGPHALRASTWRILVETGHAVVSILSGPSIRPVTGRADALRQHSYTRFARESRNMSKRVDAVPPYSPRTGLLATLRRKRTVSREVRR